jgi:Tfp pilus assembly protein PilF
VAITLGNMAVVLDRQGRLELAEERFRRALAIEEKAYGQHHPEVAVTLGNLGDSLGKQGRLDEAMARYQRALRIFEGAYGSEHMHALHLQSRIAECQAATDSTVGSGLEC